MWERQLLHAAVILFSVLSISYSNVCFNLFVNFFISEVLFVRTEAQGEPLSAFYLSADQSVL